MALLESLRNLFSRKCPSCGGSLAAVGSLAMTVRESTTPPDEGEFSYVATKCCPSCGTTRHLNYWKERKTLDGHPACTCPKCGSVAVVHKRQGRESEASGARDFRGHGIYEFYIRDYEQFIICSVCDREHVVRTWSIEEVK